MNIRFALPAMAIILAAAVMVTLVSQEPSADPSGLTAGSGHVAANEAKPVVAPSPREPKMQLMVQHAERSEVQPQPPPDCGRTTEPGLPCAEKARLETENADLRATLARTLNDPSFVASLKIEDRYQLEMQARGLPANPVMATFLQSLRTQAASEDEFAEALGNPAMGVGALKTLTFAHFQQMEVVVARYQDKLTAALQAVETEAAPAGQSSATRRELGRVLDARRQEIAGILPATLMACIP